MSSTIAPLRSALLATLVAVAPIGTTRADDVEIVYVTMSATGGAQWRADVTLRHADTGWEHYADAWRVVGPDGNELGVRTLLHPHVDERPFTRSLSPVQVPAGVNEIRVEAHDKVHGWGSQIVVIDLRDASGPRFSVER